MKFSEGGILRYYDYGSVRTIEAPKGLQIVNHYLHDGTDFVLAKTGGRIHESQLYNEPTNEQHGQRTGEGNGE